MRVVICDDERQIGEQVETYLNEYFDTNQLFMPVIDIFTEGEQLLADEGEMDIVFLDVEMPGESGIDIGQKIKKKYPDALIFILTSYTEYLDDAMRFHVFRYLTKPLEKKRLFRNMKDALYQWSTIGRKITIETKTGGYTVYEKNIILIECRSKKVYVYTREEMYQSVQTMAYWRENLAKGCFFQTHKSYIINMKYIKEYDKTSVLLEEVNERAYLTRRKYKDFKEAYLLYVESMR